MEKIVIPFMIVFVIAILVWNAYRIVRECIKYELYPIDAFVRMFVLVILIIGLIVDLCFKINALWL